MEKIQEVTEQEWIQCHKWNIKITEEFLEQGHLSPKTLYQYKSALKIFFRWVKDNCDNKPLYELKPKDALRYQNWLINKNISSAGVKFKRSAVSSLCGYVELYYADEYPIFRNIYNKKIPNPAKTFRNEKKPLNPEEYRMLVDTLKIQEKWQLVAYVEFSYASGCRREEARQLLKEVATYEKVKDKPYYATHPVRCKGKGREGVVRKLQFSDEAINAINKWLEVRGDDNCPYVFVTKQDGEYKQVAETTFNSWCTDIFTPIIGRRIHPHLFRESRATNLVLTEGKDIRAAQKLLGHQSSETTEIYVIRETDDDIDDAF